MPTNLLVLDYLHSMYHHHWSLLMTAFMAFPLLPIPIESFIDEDVLFVGSTNKQTSKGYLGDPTNPIEHQANVANMYVLFMHRDIYLHR